MTRDLDLEATIVEKWVAVRPVLDERGRRRWAGAESRAIGYGGDSLVSSATGLSRPTVRAGRLEIEAGVDAEARIRRPGGGRPRLDASQPGLKAALEALVDPVTRGDPQSPLRWTCKSRANLTAALVEAGWRVSSTSVGRLLHELGYSLQSMRKTREGASHPQRNAQFEHINATADEWLQRGEPVISVDTKKKELVGEFKNAGREWQRKGLPETALVHDFPHDGEGKAIPYGIYDMGRNEAWVNVGRDHDTPAFAVASIRRWWQAMGRSAYPNAKALFITADAGGSNGYRSRVWKQQLQKLADESGLKIRVSHLPPGTSKWNKIEHRLFCHITRNWRGKALCSFETIVDLIGNTRTACGLRVKAKLDKRTYPTGAVVTKAEMKALSLHRNDFQGEWNYELHPRTNDNDKAKNKNRKAKKSKK
jgi:transposase